jgi:hypothetical protein
MALFRLARIALLCTARTALHHAKVGIEVHNLFCHISYHQSNDPQAIMHQVSWRMYSCQTRSCHVYLQRDQSSLAHMNSHPRLSFPARMSTQKLGMAATTHNIIEYTYVGLSWIGSARTRTSRCMRAHSRSLCARRKRPSLVQHERFDTKGTQTSIDAT